MAGTQSEPFWKKASPTIGDLNPDIEAQLNMPDEEKPKTESENTGDSMESMDDDSETPEERIQRLGSPQDTVHQAISQVLPPPSPTQDIFGKLKSFDPTNIHAGERKRSLPTERSDGNGTASSNPASLWDDAEPSGRDTSARSRTASTVDDISDEPASSGYESLSQLMKAIGLDDDPVPDEAIVHERPVARRPRLVGATKGKRGAETVTAKMLTEDSEEADFVKLLHDSGVTRGKVYITERFFDKGANDPDWLNTVMTEAGISPQKKRMVIIGWFNETPERLGVKVSRVPGSADEDDPEEVLKDIEKMDAEQLKRLAVRERLDEMRERLDKGKGKKGRRSSSDDDDDDEIVEVPIERPDGSFAKDAKGDVVTVKLTKKAYFFQMQEKANLQLRNQQQSGGNEMTKMMERMHQSEMASNERLSKILEDSRATREESEKRLLGYMLNKEREEKKELMGAFKSKEQVVQGMESDVKLLERIGMVRTDKMTPLDQQTGLVKETRDGIKDVYALGKGDLREVLTWVRDDMKEERRLKNPALVSDSKMNPEDKKTFYEQMAAGMPAAPAAEEKPEPPPAPDLLKTVPLPMPLKPLQPVEHKEDGSTKAS